MANVRLVGIDIGTTATKAVLIDESGNRIAGYARAHPTLRPQPGYAEQAPDDWMAGVYGALETFASEHDLGGLAAIGVTSQVNTHVFVEGSGKPLLPAITWQDTRSGADAATLDGQVTPEQMTAWFGGPLPIDASHALSRMAHVRRVHPDLYERAVNVLLPKDYCVLQLTGAVVSDPISAVGLVNGDGYVSDLLALVPRADRLLPPVTGFTSIAGRVRAGLPCAGTPVIVGAMDAWAGMFGVGVARDGDAMYQSGTSEIPGIISSTVVPTPGVILFPPYEGIVMHAAPTQAGGAALAWFAQVLGQPPAATAAMAGQAKGNVPLFLPHLQGERAPLWDDTSRGVFARLDPSSGTAEMARGVLEGVAYAVRLAFDALRESAATDPAMVNIGGGGAASDIWCQIRADILGLPLRRAVAPEAAAFGAAILAGRSQDEDTTIAEVVERLVKYDRVFEPEPETRGYHEDRFGKYVELYQALRAFNADF